MVEQTTAQQQVREQFKVAETTVQNALRAWNDLAAVTTAVSLDVFEQNLRYSQEAVSNYRRIAQESQRAWQGYVQSVSDIINRAN